MRLDLALTVVLNGLILAALYFIVASGFSLIFGLMRIGNMAHSSLNLTAGSVGYAVLEPSHDRDDWTGDWDASLHDDLALMPTAENKVYRNAFATLNAKHFKSKPAAAKAKPGKK